MKPRRTPPGAPHWLRPSAAPFPPPGPPRRVPRLRRYYGAVRLPGPLTPDSVAFARRYPAVRLSFRSQRSRSPNRGPGVHQPVPTSGTVRRETTRASQVPRQPCCPFALFSDPGRTTRIRPIRCAGAAPAMSTTKAPTKTHLSGLNRTALGLAVYASSCALPHPTQNSLPVAGQALPDGIGYPQGCAERFQCITHILLSGTFLAQGHTGYLTEEWKRVPC